MASAGLTISTMRIVTWNMDYWQHHAVHAEAWHWLLDELDPDLALLQECVPPDWVRERYEGKERSLAEGVQRLVLNVTLDELTRFERPTKEQIEAARKAAKPLRPATQFGASLARNPLGRKTRRPTAARPSLNPA
jgi:hypothetical protein